VNSLYGAAFLMGLMGSGHCMAMCGGISSALGLSHPDKKAPALLYQFGRITSYTFAGLIVAAFGIWIPVEVGMALRLFTAFILVGVVLYMMGVTQAITKLELLGQPLWRRLQPAIKKLGKPTTYYQYWLAGILWGWLPCGLVYSALALAVTSQGLHTAPLIMLSFGLGTLPSMLSLNFAGHQLGILGKRPAIRIIGGLFLLLLAFWMLYSTGLTYFGHTVNHG